MHFANEKIRTADLGLGMIDASIECHVPLAYDRFGSMGHQAKGQLKDELST